MSALTRFFNKQKNKDYQNGEKRSKPYRIVTNISITGIFAACALLVFSFAGYLKITPFVFGLISSIFIICIACVLLLPWIRVYEKNNKKIAVIFMIGIAVCALLWLTCLYMGIDLFNKLNKKIEVSANYGLTMMNIIKFTLIISIQILMSSFIAQTIIKYKKSMIIFQIITYVSYAFVDFYITFLLLCFNISADGVSINENISLLGNRFLITLLVLAILFMVISNSIIKIIDTKRNHYKFEDAIEKIDKTEQLAEETIEDKLAKLKSLLEKDLITQEEYEQKKSDILKDI